MIDRCGRNIDYLRISVTDRCNLRCIYCMPEEGVQHVERSLILQEEEILRICRVMAELGIRKIKLTGGEPLVRPRMPQLVEKLKNMPGIEKVTLTTNGVLLKDQMSDFARAGLDGLNISLDTLDASVYRQLTRRDEIEAVRRGLRTAIQKGRMQIKINCVPVLGIEEQKLLEVAELAKNHNVHVRFIEMMPIGMGTQFAFVKEDALKHALEEAFGTFIPCGDVAGNGPCHYFAVPGFQGRIGFISAVSHKFCSECNRIRLTSEGFLKLCLYSGEGLDLRAMLRGGCSDEEIAEAVTKVIERKPKEHHFTEDGLHLPGIGPADADTRKMSQIGG